MKRFLRIRVLIFMPINLCHSSPVRTIPMVTEASAGKYGSRSDALPRFARRPTLFGRAFSNQIRPQTTGGPAPRQTAPPKPYETQDGSPIPCS
jgi:hypothetical protein